MTKRISTPSVTARVMETPAHTETPTVTEMQTLAATPASKETSGSSDTPVATDAPTIAETKSNTESLSVTETSAKPKFFQSPTVALLVGKSQKTFYIHPGLLCDASPVFKAAFTGNSVESSKDIIQLPQDDEGTIELFIEWLYRQRYKMPEKKGNEDDFDCEDDGSDRFLQAFRLFVFAERYKVSKLKKLIVEALFKELASNTPSLRSVGYAYNHTIQRSGLRKMLADNYAWGTNFELFKATGTEAFLRQQPDLATDVSFTLAKNLSLGMGKDYDPFDGKMPEEYLDEESEHED